MLKLKIPLSGSVPASHPIYRSCLIYELTISCHSAMPERHRMGADQRQEAEAGHEPVTSGSTIRGSPDDKVSSILDEGDRSRHLLLDTGWFLAVGFIGREALAVAAVDFLDPREHGVSLRLGPIVRLWRPAKAPSSCIGQRMPRPLELLSFIMGVDRRRPHERPRGNGGLHEPAQRNAIQVE